MNIRRLCGVSKLPFILFAAVVNCGISTGAQAADAAPQAAAAAAAAKPARKGTSPGVPDARLDYAPGKAPKYWSVATAETIMARYPDYREAYWKPWSYVQGYVFCGFEMLYRSTGDNKYLDYMKRYIDQFVDDNGNFHGDKLTNLDNLMTGTTIVALYEYTHDERYKTAAGQFRRVFDDYPRSDGQFWHGKGSPNMWIDGVFMGQMFLVRYGKAIGDSDYCFDEAARQMTVCAKHLAKGASGLYLHAWTEKPEKANWADPKTGLSPEVWSEGLGWYALVLSETLAAMPKDHAKRAELEDIYRRLAAGLKRTQDPKSGGWFMIVDKGDLPDNWIDPSGTAMFVYAIKRGVDIGLLDQDEYSPVAEKGFKALLQFAKINDKGLVDISGGGDGITIKKDYATYIKVKRVVNAKETVGGFLWAAAIMEKPPRAASAAKSPLSISPDAKAQSVSPSSRTAIIATKSPVSISLDAQALAGGKPVAPDFSGLSYEIEKVLPDRSGKYYFSPENKPLLAMFKTLGIKSLRVGGNTADRPTIKVPAKADIDKLFAFAKAGDIKVIYTLRMREGDPGVAAELAKYILDHYKSELTCFAIGNEPNVFAKEYPAYRDLWKKYMEAIVAPANAPGAKFCGPSATPGKAPWAADFARDFGQSGRIAMITQHDYPGGSANKVTDTAAARDKMLSRDWIKGYEKFYAKFVPAAEANKLPYRLEEANSFFNGGAKDVSDTFASALWALDYMYWWALHGANGINFHTGDAVAAGERTTACKYAAFLTAPDGYDAHPIAYGMKAFDLGSHGRIAPATIASNADGLNLTAYAVLGDDKWIYCTLINKEHGPDAREASVSIAAGKAAPKAEAMLLSAPRGDVSVTSGATLGAAEIEHDASWHGSWTALTPAEDGKIDLKLPPATAAVIRISGV